MKALIFTRGITTDGNTVTLTDATVLYGSTIPLRNTLALIPYITYIPTGGVAEVIPVAAYDPLDVATYTFGVDGKDGVYYVLIFAFPRWTTGDPLVEGEVFYNLIAQRVEKVVGGIAVPVTDFPALVNDAAVIYGDADCLVRVELTKRKDLLQLLLLQKLENLSLGKCEYNEYAKAQRDFNYVRSLWVGAYIQYCSGNKATAQRYIETGNDLGFKILAV